MSERLRKPTDKLRAAVTAQVWHDSYSNLQLIQKTDGLRKISMATGNQGKSGSTRVIYFLATTEVIYLVMAYPKSTKDSITDAEKATKKADPTAERRGVA